MEIEGEAPAGPAPRRDLVLAALNKLFIRALLALKEAGRAEAACRLAAEGWLVLRHPRPREAERLTAALHALAVDWRSHSSSEESSHDRPHDP